MRNSPLFVHGPGQQVQPAPPGTSHSGLIDPCNLFCKNLDSDIDSNSLFSHFRRVSSSAFSRKTVLTLFPVRTDRECESDAE
jgi:polyadenylate-binding protein